MLSMLLAWVDARVIHTKVFRLWKNRISYSSSSEASSLFEDRLGDLEDMLDELGVDLNDLD